MDKTQETATRNNGCPDTEHIRAFALGDLPSPSLTVVGAHIENCAPCQLALESYDAYVDTFVDRLRANVCETIIEDDAQLRELIAGAEQIWGEPRHSPVAAMQPIRLEQYDLLEVIGQGGMGVVHKAWHKKLQRHVAIKFIAAYRSPQPKAIGRFHQEMAAVGRLQHPNIVHAYDAGEMDGRPYLVMELVDGLDTRELLKRYGPLPVAAACEIIRQSAVGLQYAHGAGLLHRDIKPSNLMLTEEGCVKILDLGLARFETSEAPPDVVGTRKFVAPEQVLDSTSCDARADLYSLGGTFYFLLTGRAPIEVEGAKTLSATAALHAQVPHTPISQLRSEVPSSVIDVVNRCLEKQPDDRFAAAADVAAALEPLCRGVVLKHFVSTGAVQREHHASSSYAAAEPAARRRRVALGAAAMLLVMAAVALAWIAARGRTPPATTTETKGPPLKHSDKAGNALLRPGPADPVRVEQARGAGAAAENPEPPRKPPNPLRFGVPADPPVPGAALVAEDEALEHLDRSLLPAAVPQPQRGHTLLSGAPYQIEGVDAVNLDIVAAPKFSGGHRGFVPLAWSQDGQRLYVLDGQGGIYALNGKSLQELARLQTGAECVGISLSKEGLVLGLPGLHALWVLDPETLAVKRKIPLDDMRTIAASPSTSLCYAIGVAGIFVVDLSAGRPLHFINCMRLPGAGKKGDRQWHGSFTSMRVTDDGRYMFAGNTFGGLHRLRIEGDQLIYEQSTGNIFYGSPYDLSMSRDGKWVALPTDGGNRFTDSGIAVFDGHDLTRPVLSVQETDRLMSIGFDPSGGNIYAAGQYSVDIFGPRGGWLKRLPWKHRWPLYLAVRPDGERVAVWSRDKLVMLDFHPGRLAADLAGTLNRPGTTKAVEASSGSPK